MTLFFDTWNLWLPVAFLAPILWALVNIIDVYFVGEVFDDELDGTVIMGIFQITPWLAVFFIPFSFPDVGVSLMALVAGFLYLTSMYFYFKALFVTNDATVVSIFWNFSILLLPVASFIVLGEKLTLIQYTGLFVAFTGASLVSFNRKIKERNLTKMFFIMMGSVGFLSLSMAISGKVYNLVGFLDGFLMFSLGSFMGGLFFLFLRNIKSKKKQRKKIILLQKKYFIWFFIAEVLTLLGIVFSQRAIDLSPSVSFIAAIESAQAFFILIFSAIIFSVLSVIKSRDGGIMQSIYKEQLLGYKIKIIASFIIAVGIYMLNV